MSGDSNTYGIYTIALMGIMLIHQLIAFVLEHKHVFRKYDRIVSLLTREWFGNLYWLHFRFNRILD